MKAPLGTVNEGATDATRPTSYFGRFVRKQGQFGSVSVVGRVDGRNVEPIADPKRLFPRDGSVETQGLTQHVGLSPGDWVGFEVARNTRPRAAEYKVKHLWRIPRYAVLQEGSDAFYRALLTREGWRGDRRSGLWALRLTGGRVVIADLELSKDGALRLSPAAARAVPFYSYRHDAVVLLGDISKGEDAYLDLDAVAQGAFDWSDEADHVARVIRSLSDANDPRVSDIIAWLDLHHEAGTGKVFAATVDHVAALDALRSGELADRLRADQELMKVYLDAAVGDAAVATAVAEYAREGHTAAWARLLAELDKEVSERRAGLIAAQDAGLAKERADAVAAIDTEIAGLRARKTAEVEDAAATELENHVARMADLESEHMHRRAEIAQHFLDAQARLSQVNEEIADSASELESARGEVEAQHARLEHATSEVDRLLSVSKCLSQVPSSAGPLLASSSIQYEFPDRETISIGALAQSVNGLALLSAKGRDLMKRLLVLMLAGEMPMLYGADALDFVKLAGILASPGRTGLMRADPTLVSIEDLWARPGSGAPTILAAAAAASAGGTAALIAIVGVEMSGARFWVSALSDALRTGTLPRGLLVCGVVNDIDHEEAKALPSDIPFLEIEGVFEPGAFFGALTLPTVATVELRAVNPGPVPTNAGAAAKVMALLGFEPTLGLAMRVARITAEAVSMLGEELATTTLVIELARDINNQVR